MRNDRDIVDFIKVMEISQIAYLKFPNRQRLQVQQEESTPLSID
jgi:hypothetical protein